MQERMAPVSHWTRTYCWEYFDVNRYIKDLGDQYYYTGDYIGAHGAWSGIEHAMNFRDRIIMPFNTDDDNLTKEIARFRAICLVNMSLAAVLSAIHLLRGLQGAQDSRICEEVLDIQPDVYDAKLPAAQTAQYCYLCGIADIFLERVPDAIRSFPKAAHLDPAMTLYARCLSMTEALAKQQRTNRRISHLKFPLIATLTRSSRKLILHLSSWPSRRNRCLWSISSERSLKGLAILGTCSRTEWFRSTAGLSK
jgi:hypothetical protein